MVNSIDRTNKFKGKIEDLGNYSAENGRIKANLQLKAKIVTMAMIDSGIDWYSADFNFYTNPQWKEEKEGFSVKINYSFGSLQEIFKRVKKAEEGIEAILASPTKDYGGDMDVIKCIFSLENQTQHILKEREKVAKERERYIYFGEEKPELD